MKLRRNMGTTERWLRGLGGVAAIVAGIVFSSPLPTWGMVVLILVGASLLVEAALSWCPLKAALGRGRHQQT